MKSIKNSALYILVIFFCFKCICATIRVKVNNAFITEASEGLNGKTFKNVAVKSLQFLPNTNTSIYFVINFNELTKLQIENNELLKIPVLENLQNVADISLKNNKITIVYSNNFMYVQPNKINLNNNAIKNIEDKSFNTNIRVLSLRCNELNSISSKWFQRAELLENLDISNNFITSIKSATFKDFKLKYINLSGNQITSIEPNSFTYREIEVLNLRSNFLSELNPNIFYPANVHIRRLYLDYNKLNYLSLQLMEKLYGFDILHLINVVRTAVGDLKAMSIDGNPWECKCLAKIERWLKTYKIARHVIEPNYEDAKCVFSLKKTEICVDAVDPELYETFSKSVSRIGRQCSET